MPDNFDFVAKVLKEYIDVNVLTEAVCQALVDAKVPLTIDNAKKLWLSFLENSLSENLKESIERVDSL
jgi:hypothetical protein